ncbi:unnamed protein product [Linum trigynum]|uniref:Uncharacterized protein n=1 Tax=Linum trigynum TaxID=586398 RepID=A0AAV2CIU8_9ROSI
MDRAAATMEVGLTLEEGRSLNKGGRQRASVETSLSLGQTKQQRAAQYPSQAGPVDAADYQHFNEAGEENVGQKKKKRKGMGLASGGRSTADLIGEEDYFVGPAGSFEMRGQGEATRKKNKKFMPQHPNSSKGINLEIDPEGKGKKNKAVVFRQKPPLQE